MIFKFMIYQFFNNFYFLLFKYYYFNGERMESILIVDDSIVIRKAIIKLLKLSGYPADHIQEANDGQQALTLVRENAYDLIFSDINMPNMDGIAAMNEIYNIRPDVKVILASGFNEEELGGRITGQTPSGFIRKPYSFNALEEIFRGVVQANSR